MLVLALDTATPSVTVAVSEGSRVLAERTTGATFQRLVTAAAVVLPALQLYGVYVNARRYAVPPTGHAWFVPDARWSPPLGWLPWLVLGTVACVAMSVGRLWLLRSAPVPAPD